MDKRKTSKSNLEGKQMIFIEIGLIVALAVSLCAFEWKKYDISKVEIAGRNGVEVPIDIVIQAKHEVKPPPPKAVTQPTTELNVVKNDVEVKTDVQVSAETNDADPPEIWEPTTLPPEDIDEPDFYIVVEKDPEFPGGEIARLKYLRDNVKYPQAAREAGIQGIVYLSFIIEASGTVSNVEVLRGIGGGCDEEAVRVVKNMPKWSPGEQRDQKVRVQYSLQIKFTLQGS